MQSRLRMADATLAGLAGTMLVGAVCAGCCGSVQTTTWRGTLAFAFPAAARLDADGGTGSVGGAATVAGSFVTTVALDAFAPWVQNGFSGGYCGADGFTVSLAPACVLTAHVASTDWASKGSSDTAAATLDAGQTCTLSTAQGAFSVAVQGGNLAVSGNEVNVLLDTPNANVEFVGDLQ